MEPVSDSSNNSTEVFEGQAAVLIVVTGEGEGERLLLTQRAAHLTLHSGEVAFPGGMWEPGDRDLRDTALRETHEEVGLAPEKVTLLGEMAAGQTGRGIQVTPFVARAEDDVRLQANTGELEAFFWVPTGFLLEDQRDRTDLFQRAGREYWAPVYTYMGYTIWGFTARVLVQYLNNFWGADIGREHTAPEDVYRRR